jgi:hypothetical protein
MEAIIYMYIIYMCVYGCIFDSALRRIAQVTQRQVRLQLVPRSYSDFKVRKLYIYKECIIHIYISI